METITIVYIVLAFVVGIVVGTAISWNHQANCNINAGLPICVGFTSTASRDAYILSNFLRKRIAQTGCTFFHDWYKNYGIKDAERLLLPKSGESVWLKQFLKLICSLGLEMELRKRSEDTYTHRDDDHVVVNVHYTD